MRAANATNGNRAHVKSESIADAWREQSLCASRASLVACAIAGGVGLAAFFALPPRWACIPLALGIAGIFAIAGFLAQAELAAPTPVAAASFRRLRSIADVVAILLAAGVIVSALGLLFGGSVGVMRV
jgi:hypothetical protein